MRPPDARFIPLTRGYVAVVDEQDYERLSRFKWHARVERGRVYAARNVSGARTTMRMHGEILGAPKGTDIDHADGDGLNNRRSNLRLATRAQNSANRRVQPHSSRFKGVHWHRLRSGKGRWRARIKIHSKTHYLGLFGTEEDAARAYDSAAIVAWGSFARLNCPEISDVV